MRLLRCKTRLNKVDNRFVYIIPTGDQEKIRNRGLSSLSDEAIDKACERRGSGNLTEANLEELKRRLKKAKASGDQDLVRRFVVAIKTNSEGADNIDEICALQEQAFKETQILQTNNESVAPWKKLIHKYAGKPRYDEARKSALELYDSGDMDGKKLVAALVGGQIEFPESFVAYAEALLHGSAAEREVIHEELQKPDKTLGYRIKIKLNSLLVKDDKEAGVEVAIKGLQKEFKVKEKAIVKEAEEPLSEYTVFRRKQLRDASEKLRAANAQYAPLQDNLRSFVEKELEVSMSAKSTGGDPFNTADKKMGRFFGANEVYLNGVHGATPEQKMRLIINNRILDGAFYDPGDPAKIFNRRWQELQEMAAKYGVKIDMSQAHKNKLLHDLRDLGELDKAKAQCEPHLRVIREIKAEQMEIYNRQEGEGKALLARRTETGLGELPRMMDREGNYEPEVKTDIPLIITEGGKTFKVKLTKVLSEAQTDEGKKDRDESVKDEAYTGVKGQIIYQIEGVDGEGQKYSRKMPQSAFLEYVKVNNARRDFSDYKGEEKVETAEEILQQQTIHKANIKIAKGFSFVHTYDIRLSGDTTKIQSEIVTIRSVDTKKGTVTLDQDIKLFDERDFKNTTEPKDRNEQKRPKGKPIDLGEFLGWVMREDVSEYIEEDPQLKDEGESILNRKLREDHERQVAFEEEAAKKAETSGDKPSSLPSKPLQVDKDWQIVRSAGSGKVYAVRRNPENANSVQIAEAEKEQPKLHVLGNSGPEAQHLNKTGWKVKNLKNKHAASALFWFRDNDVEAVDENIDQERVKGADFGESPQAVHDQEAAVVSSIKQQKKDIQDAVNAFKVEEADVSQAALEKQYDNTISAAPSGTAGNETSAPPAPSDPEDNSMEKRITQIRNAGKEAKVQPTEHAIADLDLTDPKEMSYSRVGFMRRVWMNTTFLNNSDIFEMGKSMYEYIKRRWDRNTKNRFSKVGKNIPFFTTEMDRINQNAETEEMQQFKDAMDSWGVWQIEDALYTTNNRDQAKACLIVLAEKGKLRWENTKLWETINKFTEPQFYVPIPKNGDAQMRDPRTGKSGIELLPAAIDSLWGQGQYNDWYTQNASKYQSTAKQYFEEGKQLDHDPYNNGGIDGRLRQLLKLHKEGYYIDNQEFEGLLHYCFEAGKSIFENKFYFVVAGVTQKNDRGETILTWDRLGSLDSEYLTRLPWLDFFTNQNIMRANGQKGGWNRRDLTEWIEEWDKHAPPGFENLGEKNPALWKFLWTSVLNHPRTIIRTNKALRNAENMDHDDAHFIIPLANEMLIEEVLKGPTGGKKYFTFEGYANAYGGYAELMKSRAGLETAQPNLVFNLIRSFVRYDAILSGRLHRSEGSRYARMDKSYWKRKSVISSVHTGIHRSQMQELIKNICSAYGYDAGNIFKDLPEGDEYRAEQRQIEIDLKNFGQKLEELIAKDGDGGKKMMDEAQKFIENGQMLGLSPSASASARRKKEDETDSDKSLEAAF